MSFSTERSTQRTGWCPKRTSRRIFTSLPSYIRAREAHVETAWKRLEIFDRGDATKSRLAYVNITLVEDAPCPISAAPPSGTGYPHHELYGLTPLPIFGE
jgi:hypothetical protein